MLKRRLSLVLAIVMAIGMMLSFAGCPTSYISSYYRGRFIDHEGVEVIVNRKSIEFEGVEYSVSDLDVETDFFFWVFIPRHSGTITGNMGDKYTFKINSHAHAGEILTIVDKATGETVYSAEA